MNVSKKIIAIAAVCATLGVGVTAYASNPASENSIIPQPTDSAAENSGVIEDITDSADSTNSADNTESAPVEDETAPAKEENSPVEEKAAYMNVPSEGDEIENDKYFIHTYSNGDKALIPFNPADGEECCFVSDGNNELTPVPNVPIDVEAIKKLGSDTPYKDEICYEVVEFLDGTKRYFKLGEDRGLSNCYPQYYGIHSYTEAGTGVPYYEEISCGYIQGWK